jgi:hypothetical protein
VDEICLELTKSLTAVGSRKRSTTVNFPSPSDFAASTVLSYCRK